MNHSQISARTSAAGRCSAVLLLLLTFGLYKYSSTSSLNSPNSLRSGSAVIGNARKLQQAPAKGPPAVAPSNSTQGARNGTATAGLSNQLAPAKGTPGPSAVAPSSVTTGARNRTAATGLSNQHVCKWHPEDGKCTPTHVAWTSAGPGMPSSSYRRAVLMASERDRHCSQHETAAACAADVKMRCFMQGAANATNSRCASSDMEEMLLWSAKGFLTNMSVIPHAMTCAGSHARTFYDCYAFAAQLDACRALPHCIVLPHLGTQKNICVPKSWLSTKFGDLRKIFQGLVNLEPQAYGTCGATCWLQEARECSNITAREACNGKAYCTFDELAALRASSSILNPLWDEEDPADDELSEEDLAGLGGRAAAAQALTAVGCRHKSQEFSSSSLVDQAAQKVYERCANAKTDAACKHVVPAVPAAGAARRRVPMVDWKSYVANDTGAKCAQAAKAVTAAASKTNS